MRDAMGGTVTIVIILVFIVFALGYMAFNVNYTKAFRMKDKIVSLYDDYDGKCTSDCQAKIKEYANSIGYSSGAGTGVSADCPNSTDDNISYTPDPTNTYCYVEKKLGVGADDKERVYYKIATQVTIDVPILKNILRYLNKNRAVSFNVFYVFGDTKTYKYNTNT